MGKGYFITGVFHTGNPYVDGLLSYYRWGDATVYYSFPSSASVYGYSGEPATFSPVNASQRAAARFALDRQDGNAANDGFSVEGFTRLTLEATTYGNTQIRLGNFVGTADDTAFAYLPDQYTDPVEGDVWFANSGLRPVAGNYDWYTVIHELGHALGLEHPHNDNRAYDYPAEVPLNRDAPEYTVMSYRSYIGGPMESTIDPDSSYPQSYMMLDIQALQQLYGANYGINAGNTTYFWVPTYGGTYVDGAIAINPGANKIFATIWDGGGSDTYHLASYTTPVFVDLRPGYASVFSGAQLADLGNGRFAGGNIYNALQFNNDPRSLIENVYGGSAADAIIGNQVGNLLVGLGGNDQIWGMEGDDYLLGGDGADFLSGVTGYDFACYWGSAITVVVRLDIPPASGGTAGQGSGRYGEAEGDVLDGIEGLIGSAQLDYLIGNAGVNILLAGAGGDFVFGLGGNDVLDGQDGADWIWGNDGLDTLTGGTGADVFVFDSGLNAATNVDVIADFQAGIDDIWLDDAIMSAVGAAGGLAAWAFLSTGTGVATAPWQRIIYNSATGVLSYDPDGSDARPAVAFAYTGPGVAFSHTDFFIF